jgi:hypothetical protein
VIDSAAYACGPLDAETSMAARQYSAAVTELGLPVVTLAHVTKANLDPKHPYGSVFWSNGARVTISVSRKSEAEDAPRVLKNKKTNQRGSFPPVEIDWKWTTELGPGELPTDLTFAEANLTAGDRAYEALFMKGWMTAADVHLLVLQDGGKPVEEQAIRKAMDDNPRFEKDGTGRGVKHLYRAGPVITRSRSGAAS